MTSSEQEPRDIPALTSNRAGVDRLVYLPVAGALVVMAATLLAFTLSQRSVVIERAQRQLEVTVSSLADFNELAQQAGGNSTAGTDSRSAAIWRALLQYPTAHIWVEADGSVSAGQEPTDDLRGYVLAEDARTGFTVHAALPRADAIADWQRATEYRCGAMLAVSIGFIILARFLVRALKALREHDALLNMVTMGARRLLGVQHDDDLQHVLELVGRTLGVSRAQFCEITQDQAGHLKASTRQEWRAADALLFQDSAAMQVIDLTECLPRTVSDALPAGPVSFRLQDLSGPGRELYERVGMNSCLLIPVVVKEKLWGALSFIDSGSSGRTWTWAESDTLKTLSGLIGVAVARARYVKELADANMIVQNSPTILYRLRGEPPFPLVYVSHNITKFGHDPQTLLGPRWTAKLIDPADETKVTEAMARVLEKDSGPSSIEFRLRAADGSQRWVENRYTPVRDADGRLIEVEGIIIDVTERKAAEEKIAQLARTDGLTGLANRTTFVERLNQAFAAAKRGANPFAILYIDLDHFKEINDTLGHPVGDALLIEVAARLRRSTRSSDLVARLGGDEFAVLQSDVVEPASAGILASKLQACLALPYNLGANQVDTVTASIGVCPFTPAAESPEIMLTQADRALYRSKHAGRNQYHFHTEDLDRLVQANVTLKAELEQALVQGELELFYQPQVEIGSGQIVGMEALIRWNHPRHGQDAAEFILQAEKAKMMVQIGHWVLEQCCKQMRLWRDSGAAPPSIAINLSVSQLKDSGELVRNVAAMTARYGIEPRCLEFDVTEATLAHVTLTRNDTLRQLRQLGSRVAIDDFGSNYSSFEYIRAYDINHLKIAQSYIRAADKNPQRAAIVHAIISFAAELGIGVIAEGVETMGERTFLASAGSMLQGQGHFFSKAVSSDRAGELLLEGSVMPMASTDAALLELSRLADEK
jgi:diguanylate cyclase (GGDEF)-like protein/PAS domain S-box-containing protein